MQRTKTLGNAIDHLKFLMVQPPVGGAWNDPELIQHINSAQKDLAQLLPSALLGEVLGMGLTQGLTTNVDNFPLPSDYLKYLSGVRYTASTPTTTRRKLVLVDISKLRDLQVNSNYPSQMIRECYIAILSTWFYIFPTGTTGQSVAIDYAKEPTELSSSTDTLQTIDAVFDILVARAGFLAAFKYDPNRATGLLNLTNQKIAEVNLIYQTNIPQYTIPQQQK